MEREGLALLRVVEAEIHLQRLVRRGDHLGRQAQLHVLFELLGLELNVRRLLRVHRAHGQAHAGVRALGHFQVLRADQVVGPVIVDLRLQRDDIIAAELVTLIERGAQQRQVQRHGPRGNLPGLLAAFIALEGGTLGNEPGAFVVAATARHVALGEDPLTIVVAQFAVGVGHDFAPAVVVAKQRAPAQRRRHWQVEIIEDRCAQVDMSVHPGIQSRQLLMFRCQRQVEAPRRRQTHTIDAVGFVRGDHHQRVLEHALAFEAAEELPSASSR